MASEHGIGLGEEKKESISRRGSCDSLSETEQQDLNQRLEKYIRDKQKQEKDIWVFGRYGQPDSKQLEKAAPLLPDIVNNVDLLEIVLEKMPHAKMKDRYFLKALQTCLEEIRNVNESDLPDDIFKTWVVKALHMQVSHLRNLKQYSERYAYRVERFNKNATKSDEDKLERLLALIKVPEKACVAPRTLPRDSVGSVPQAFVAAAKQPDTPTDFMALVPQVFREHLTNDNISKTPQKQMRKDCMALVPQIFREHLGKDDVCPEVQTPMRKTASCLKIHLPEEYVTPKKREYSKLFEDALKTPAPPPKRGAIRATCTENEPSSIPASSGSCTAKVERALTGNVRSYVRVRSELGKREMWAELREAQHSSHNEIMQMVADAINKGKVTTKVEAQEYRDEVIGLYPDC